MRCIKWLFLLLALVVVMVACTKPDLPPRPEDDDPEVPDSPVTPEDPGTPKTLHILAIGNSFSSDAVEQNLWNLFDAAGIPVVIGNLFAPGSYLSHHWNRVESQAAEYKYAKVVEGVAKLEEGWVFDAALADEPWDYISLQQASDLSGVYKTYYPYLPDLMQYISGKVESEIVFHQTWAYPAHSTQEAFATYGNDQMTMYQAIMDVTKTVTKENGINTVIPSGTAIQNARTSRLGDTLNRDGLHLEMTYGRYIAACTWFETLSGQSVVGNAYYPVSLTPDLALLCQTAAHLACLHPYEVTLMTHFQ